MAKATKNPSPHPHFILCRRRGDKDEKAPQPGQNWMSVYPDIHEAKIHWEDKNNVGLVPGSAGLLVLDVDDGDPGPLAEEYPPLLEIVTPSGGSHLYYSRPEAPKTIGNRKFSLLGVTGDVRGDKGYVVMWEFEATLELVDKVARGGILSMEAPEVAWRKEKRAAGVGAARDVSPVGRDIEEETLVRLQTWSEKAYLEIEEAGEGERNNVLNERAYETLRRWIGHGLSTDEPLARIQEAASRAGLDDYEIESTIISALKSAKDDPMTLPERAITFDRKGFLAALEGLGYDIRFNVLSDRREFFVDDRWVPATKRIKSRISHDIADNFFFPKGAKGKKAGPAKFATVGAFTDISDAIFSVKNVDPFADWLDTLEWDGVPRIDFILESYFGAEPGEITRWCSSYLFLCAVERTRTPGAKVDEVPVLIGPKGCGKTTFVRGSLPDEFRDNAGDVIIGKAQAMAEALQGKLVAEIGEGHWLTRADRSAVKDFLSRQDDGASVRKAYRGDPSPQLRRTAIVVTADNSMPLPNDPNLRRFVVTKLGHGTNVEGLYENEREQYWAEAVYRIDDRGETARLPRGLLPKASIIAEAHRSRDMALEDAVESTLEERIGKQGYCTSQELVDGTRMNVSSVRSNHIIYNAARALGFELVQRRFPVDGKSKKLRAWISVEEL